MFVEMFLFWLNEKGRLSFTKEMWCVEGGMAQLVERKSCDSEISVRASFARFYC